jgi:hypothetical protein
MMRDLSGEICASIERSFDSSTPVAGVTKGRGTTYSVDVAGTSHRTDVVVRISARYPPDTYAPACLRRDPTNEYDPNAVQVFVDGYHVGFLKRQDAEKWQACLMECERQGLTLCARASFYGPHRWGVELLVKREPPRSEDGTSDPALDKTTYTRLSGIAKKYGLKASKRGSGYRLLPGKPYGHGARQPLTGWEDRVFALNELEDLLRSAERSYEAVYGFESD